jgi:hypothetical protein
MMERLPAKAFAPDVVGVSGSFIVLLITQIDQAAQKPSVPSGSTKRVTVQYISAYPGRQFSAFQIEQIF